MLVRPEPRAAARPPAPLHPDRPVGAADRAVRGSPIPGPLAPWPLPADGRLEDQHPAERRVPAGHPDRGWLPGLGGDAFAELEDDPALRHDLAPYLKTEDAGPAFAALVASVDLDYTPEEAEAIIVEALAPLGRDYQDVVARAFKPEYDAIQWARGKTADAHFLAWCEGRTGYPLVDAAMAQINQTGYMHNRLRMVVASFLVKDLGIDWRRGEAWFALHLNDFDLAANNGGWQWAASTGCDAQPWFRIFNPVTQSEKFDPEGKFIRRYVPELAKLPAERPQGFPSAWRIWRSLARLIAWP